MTPLKIALRVVLLVATGFDCVAQRTDEIEEINSRISLTELHPFDKSYKPYATEAVRSARKLQLPAEEGKALRALASFTLEASNPSVAAFDSARKILLQSRLLAEKSNDSSAIAWTNCLIGKMHYFKGYWIRGATKELDSVRLYLEPAIRYGSRYGIKSLLSECYHYYSLSLRGESSNFQTIVNLKLDALTYNDSVQQPVLRARILNHLGSLYLNFGGGLKGESLAYFERALRIAKGIGAADITTSILSDISDYYMLLNQKEKSLRYFNEAINVARKAGLPKREASLYFQAGRIYLHFEVFDSAVTNFKYCAIAHDKLNQQWAIPICRGFMAKGYLLNHQRDSARMLIAGLDREVADLIKNKSEFFSVKEILQVIVSVYEQLHDNEGLARNQARLINLQDSVYSKQNQADFEGALAARNLELERQKAKIYEYEKLIRDNEIVRQRTVILIMVVTLVILIFFAFGMLYYSRVLRKLNLKLKQSAETIESQKEELVTMLHNLKNMQGQLVSAEKMASLGHLAAGVAHELNNPLNFISGGVWVMEEVFGKLIAGNISLEEKKQVFKESMTMFKNINNGVERMASIIDSLQVFTNPRETLTESSETDLAECIDASLILLKSKLEGQSVTVTRSYSSCMVKAHSGRLSQVFINLIDNAIYAVKDRPADDRKLEISVTMTDDTASVHFTDNGSGIPEEIRNNIFHAFFTTKDTGQGTGLGLFICHSIMEEFGGGLSFTSKVDAGTTFTVSLIRSKF